MPKFFRAMKTISISMVALLCFAGTSNAQSDAPRRPAAARLSDAYAVAALSALKAIEADLSVFEMRGREVIVTRATGTQEKIDQADVKAVTKAETLTTEGLHLAYMRRLSYNVVYETQRRRWGMNPPVNSVVGRKLEAERQNQAACFVEFETLLRARSSKVPTCLSEDTELED